MATGGTVCRFFNSTGGCWHGDNCKFVHDSDCPETGTFKSRRCRYYRTQSGCKFGTRCQFRHDDGETRVKLEMQDLHFQMKSLSLHDEKYKWESLEKEESSLRVEFDNHGDVSDHQEPGDEPDSEAEDGGTDWRFDQTSRKKDYCGEAICERCGHKSNGEDDNEDDDDDDDYNDDDDDEEDNEKDRKLDKLMADKAGRTKPEIHEATCGECGSLFLGDDAFEMLGSHYIEKLLKFQPTHLKFLSTDARFDEPTLCVICDKFFARSRDLLRHTVDKTQRTDKQGEEHMLILKKGIVDPFCYRDTVEHDDERLTEELCFTLLTTPEYDSDDENLFALLRFGAHLGGHHFYDDDDDDDDDDYEGGMFGFTSGECEELLCQGVKPWDSDAEDVLDALNGYY